MKVQRAISKRRRPWQGTLIAFLALGLALTGLVVLWLPGIDSGSARFISGAAWKLALVLGLAWVALPQLERLGWHRLSDSAQLMITAVIILLVLRPRIGAIAAGVVVAGCLATMGFSLVRRFFSSGK